MDIITHNGVFEVIDAFRLSLDESYRVLKPGGMIGFSVFGRMGVSNALRLYKRIVMKLDLRFEVPQPRIEFSDP